MAIDHHRAGDLVGAEIGYRQVLARDPSNADAIHFLGVIAHQVGRHADAERQIREAIARDPDQPAYHNNLGEVLRALGKMEEAVAAYREAVALAPDYADAYNNLGLALHELGRDDQALVALRRAIALAPEMAEARMNEGNVLREMDRIEASVASYDAATVADPSLGEAWLNAGVGYFALRHMEQALGYLNEACGLLPESAAARVALGDVLQGLRRYADAEEQYRQACMLDGDLNEARIGLAESLARQDLWDEALAVYVGVESDADSRAELLFALSGRLGEVGALDAAEQALRRASAIEPDQARWYTELAVLLVHSSRIEEALAALDQALEADPEYPQAHHRRGELLVTSGDLEGGIAALERALELKPDLALAYESLAMARRHGAQDAAMVERIEGLLETPDFDAGDRAALHFAAGKILDDCGDYDRAFPHFAACNRSRRETLHFNPALHHEAIDRLIATFSTGFFERKRGIGDPSEVPLLIVGMPRSGTTLTEQILTSHPEVAGAGEVNYFNELQLSFGGRMYPECVELIDADSVATVAAEYLGRLRERGGAAARITDKMPVNFLHLGLIALLFPNARIVHCRREPLDICLSIFMQNFTFADGNPWAFDLADIGCYYREYERLMAHWRQVLPLRMIEIRYEELVADTETQARALIELAGLPWDDGCLRPERNTRRIMTASLWQARQPVYRSSVARWKRYERHLGPLQAALAGACVPHPGARGAR